jgi:hypothetical protein
LSTASCLANWRTPARCGRDLYDLDSDAGRAIQSLSPSGGRVNVVGLRLPEEEEEKTPPTRMAAFRRKLSELWSQVAGI